MEWDEFEWDDDKADANLRRHGIDFPTATRVFDDPFLIVDEDDSEDYGEERLIATGVVDGVTVVVVFTERGNRTRIISARKATQHEQRHYDRG
jgi:uncharacterized protein